MENVIQLPVAESVPQGTMTCYLSKLQPVGDGTFAFSARVGERMKMYQDPDKKAALMNRAKLMRHLQEKIPGIKIIYE